MNDKLLESLIKDKKLFEGKKIRKTYDVKTSTKLRSYENELISSGVKLDKKDFYGDDVASIGSAIAHIDGPYLQVLTIEADNETDFLKLRNALTASGLLRSFKIDPAATKQKLESQYKDFLSKLEKWNSPEMKKKLQKYGIEIKH